MAAAPGLRSVLWFRAYARIQIVYYGCCEDMRVKDEGFKWVLSQLSDLSQFSDEFRSYCEEHKLDEGKIFELELSLEELIVNSFIHGYQEGGGEGTVVVEAEDIGPDIRVSVRDYAFPFDLFRDAPAPRLGGEDPRPETTPELEIESESQKEKEGGLGLHLVKSLNDRVEYYGARDGNIVVIIKSKL